jgi:VWFA-related protein
MAFLFLAAAASGLQASPPQTSQPSQPVATFQKKTALVLVPAVVTDKSGIHVHGLKQDDFAILQDGRHTDIAFFESVHTEPRVQERAPGGTISNTLKPSETQSRLTIIVLDTLNTAFFDQVEARREIVKFLSTVDPGEPVALINLNRSGLKVIHDFTTDPRVLAAAVKKMKGEIAFQDTSTGDSLPETLPNLPGVAGESAALQAIEAEPEGAFAAIQQRFSIKVTLEAMRQIAKAFAGVPGRKSVIWATGGIPFSVDDPDRVGYFSADFIPLYADTWRDLNNANVAVYPLDLEGNTNPAYVSPAIGGRRALRLRRNRTSNLDNLELFAKMTGGRFCAYASDLKDCFKHAADDSGDYYLLAVKVDSKKEKTGWHKLKVLVPERDGLEVRARNAFFIADDRAPKDAELQGQAEVAMGLTAPMDYTEYPFAIRWVDVQRAPEGKLHCTFAFLVRPSDVAIVSDDENHINVAFAVLATSPQGQVLGHFSQILEGHLKPDTAQALLTHGLVYQGVIDVPAGDGSLRFLIRENVSGRMGSLKTPIPPLTVTAIPPTKP